MTDLRQQFQSRFAATATSRLRRALAALSVDPATVYNELHGLAGEAGIMGFADISTAAAAGLEVAQTWRTTKPTGDQQLRCARILRSLVGLVDDLQRTAAPPREVVPTLQRALVVEDSELIADELADALREAGFEATIASTMDDAVTAARSAAPNVVLVDINIPGVDFRTLCAGVREHARSAKMLVVSASSDDELRRVAQDVGADGYVGKLRGTQNIIAYVKHVLGGDAP